MGIYSVTVKKRGFKTAVVSGIHVEVSSERRAEVALQPGALAQTVEVSGEALPLVETTSNTLGGAFESSQVEALPINGRDYTKLLINVPGAAGEPNGAGDSPGSFGYVAVNGNRGRANNFMLDGTDENDGYRNDPAINEGGVFGTPGTGLPLDGIAEGRGLANFEPRGGGNAPQCLTTFIACVTNQPGGVINPVILNFLNFCQTKGSCSGGKNIWRGVNIPNAPAGAANSLDAVRFTNNINSMIVKIDHAISTNHQLSGRYFFGDSTQSFPLGLPGR